MWIRFKPRHSGNSSQKTYTRGDMVQIRHGDHNGGRTCGVSFWEVVGSSWTDIARINATGTLEALGESEGVAGGAVEVVVRRVKERLIVLGRIGGSFCGTFVDPQAARVSVAKA